MVEKPIMFPRRDSLQLYVIIGEYFLHNHVRAKLNKQILIIYYMIYYILFQHFIRSIKHSRNEIFYQKHKWNRNEMKWNEMKWNEMKWNEMKWNEMK